MISEDRYRYHLEDARVLKGISRDTVQDFQLKRLEAEIKEFEEAHPELVEKTEEVKVPVCTHGHPYYCGHCGKVE